MKILQTVLVLLLMLLPALPAFAEKVEPGEEIITHVLSYGVKPPTNAPDRGDESEGPFKRLVIKNANIIDGAGAPPQGPATIIIEGDRIVDVKTGGTVSLHGADEALDADTKVIDAAGKYVLPGFVNTHVHTGSPTHAFAGSMTDPEYVLKLWLAHGITTVRDVGAGMGFEWTLNHKKRSEEGEIAAPRILVYPMFPEKMASEEAAREWTRAVKQRGADGIKFTGAAPELIAAVVDEGKKLGLRFAHHHSPLSVTRTNVLDSARMGIDSMEHWYGLPEAMFEDRVIQNYSYDYNYSNEQDRFGEAGNLWLQSAAPGSDKWLATIKELVDLDFTISPTFTIYEPQRDLMRARNADWHEEYTMPYVMRSFQPNPRMHGAFFFDWTTSHEIAWKKNYQRWMTFINDYKNAGGRVTTGSDPGFIYSLYGFNYVREFELLQEAGFHPLEVVQAATINGAELLGLGKETGSIQIGKKADLVIVDENPLANFKVLYGTGHKFLNLETSKMEVTEGIRYTIKDGIVFDAKKLLEDVRELVAEQKVKEAEQAKLKK